MEGKEESCPWCGSPITRARFREIEGAIREAERKKLAAAEATLRKEMQESLRATLEAAKLETEKRVREQATKQINALSDEKDTLTASLKEIKAREAEFRKQVQEQADRKVSLLVEKEVNSARVALQKESDRAALKAQAESNRERERFQKKIKEMERQLQSKTGNEMGDGAEIDLFETLRENFPDDKIQRVAKGQPGADIWQDVVHKGNACGRIVFDSKNRQAWQYAFVTKLKQDQLDAEAGHAVLSSTVFPRGEKDLCVVQGVIVVSPARAMHIVRILRDSLIRMTSLGLSAQARVEKMSLLYKFITSPVFHQRFEEVSSLTQAVLDLDVEEQKEHQKVWKERGRLMVRQKNQLRELDTEICAIVEGGAEMRGAVRASRKDETSPTTARRIR